MSATVHAVPLPHHCHAIGCEVEVEPKFLMCFKHWRMVPPEIQRLIWKHYRPGQEVDKRPSDVYLIVARRAVQAVAEEERQRRILYDSRQFALDFNDAIKNG